MATIHHRCRNVKIFPILPRGLLFFRNSSPPLFLSPVPDPSFVRTSTSGLSSEENNGPVVTPRSSASWECLPRRYLRSRLEVQSKLRTCVEKCVCVRRMLVGFAARAPSDGVRLRASRVTSLFRIIHGRW